MRSLTIDEIEILEKNGCHADDWTGINVAEEFSPEHIRDVDFYGEVTLGVFDKSVTIDKGFARHTGICRAALHDVTIGDNCLIENVGNYISRYDIGEECVITNVGMITTTEGAYFGQANQVAVLNEAGEPNVIVYDSLTSQMTAFMIQSACDRELADSIRQLVEKHVNKNLPERGTIGFRVKIANTREIVNCIIDDDCEINGASRITDSTLKSCAEASVYIGHDVICENTIVQAGSSILDGAKLDNCFIGETCHIGKGFSAESSLFFANSHMDNGEACAAFCGPFSVSHHKSSLLIGVETSFYNAGSATNYSNHAYKMGPIHYGTLQRGSKTASGAHILMPATIGAFSMCMGKIMTHPDTSQFPFSYVIADGTTTWLVPGCNLATVGTYRDTAKWKKRDRRPLRNRISIVNTDWLSPYVIQQAVEARHILSSALDDTSCSDRISLSANGIDIRPSSARKAIDRYGQAIEMFLGETMKASPLHLPSSSTGTGEWTDLSGLIAPKSEVEQLCHDILEGKLTTTEEVERRFQYINSLYVEYKWNYAYRLALDFYDLDTITDEDAEMIITKGEEASKAWKSLVANDAEKEYALGDVNQETLNEFLKNIIP